MFKNLTVALLATTLLAGPVLAQSTMSAAPAPATQPVKAPAVKTTVTTAKPIFAKAHKATKVSKVKKHKVKKLKVAKHVKHMTVAKHRNHANVKSTTPSLHN